MSDRRCFSINTPVLMTALPARRLSPSPLLTALSEQLKLRHYSERTSRAYTGWVLRYIRFHGKRHPRELGGEHVVEFLSALAIRIGCLLVVFTNNPVVAFYGALTGAVALTALFFGQRVANDYVGAAVLVPYFLLSLSAIYLLAEL